MSRKKIYSTELKLEIVQRYQQGNVSMNVLSKLYHVHKSDIAKWNAAYLEHGIEGLCTMHRAYTGEFKVAVVEYMHSTGSSVRNTATHFNIPSHSTVMTWERIYYELGKEALYEEQRGRKSKMGTKQQRESKKNIETNEDLLAEVQRLRMENEYLKKLNALVQKREKSKKMTK